MKKYPLSLILGMVAVVSSLLVIALGGTWFGLACLLMGLVSLFAKPRVVVREVPAPAAPVAVGAWPWAPPGPVPPMSGSAEPEPEPVQFIPIPVAPEPEGTDATTDPEVDEVARVLAECESTKAEPSPDAVIVPGPLRVAAWRNEEFRIDRVNREHRRRRLNELEEVEAWEQLRSIREWAVENGLEGATRGPIFDPSRGANPFASEPVKFEKNPGLGPVDSHPWAALFPKSELAQTFSQAVDKGLVARRAGRDAKREELLKLREWAKENGFDLVPRQLLPDDVVLPGSHVFIVSNTGDATVSVSGEDFRSAEEAGFDAGGRRRDRTGQ